MAQVVISENIPKRKRKRKDGGLSLTTISGILNNTLEPRNFSKLMLISKPVMKKGFLKYLNYCLEKRLIQKNPGEKNFIIYKITDNGRNFLELIK